jgi:hypothetical protein
MIVRTRTKYSRRQPTGLGQKINLFRLDGTRRKNQNQKDGDKEPHGRWNHGEQRHDYSAKLVSEGVFVLQQFIV